MIYLSLLLQQTLQTLHVANVLMRSMDLLSLLQVRDPHNFSLLLDRLCICRLLRGLTCAQQIGGGASMRTATMCSTDVLGEEGGRQEFRYSVNIGINFTQSFEKPYIQLLNTKKTRV